MRAAMTLKQVRDAISFAANERDDIEFSSPAGQTIALSFGSAAGSTYCEVIRKPRGARNLIWLRQSIRPQLIEDLAQQIVGELY